ncbi:MAG: PHP domain-containing protein, partial [Paraprevotella sp.]|nr:PHP domain-containing protein [Paraprevotella sp.]
MQDFVHLHVHTQYSILDGQASVQRLVDKAMKDCMKGMAITDHGNMMAIKEFFNYTTKKNSGTNADIKLWKKRISLLESGVDAAATEWTEGQAKKRKEAEEMKRKAEANGDPIPAEAHYEPENQPEFPPIEAQLATARDKLT